MNLDPTLVAISVGLSVGVFVLALVAVPMVLVRLPVDYFTRDPGTTQRNVVIVIAKNALGATLIVVGIALLVLPGQGVLTVIAGVSLLDFPGRRRLVCHLLRQSQVRRATNAIRHRAGKPPLELDPPT